MSACTVYNCQANGVSRLSVCTDDYSGRDAKVSESVQSTMGPMNEKQAQSVSILWSITGLQLLSEFTVNLFLSAYKCSNNNSSYRGSTLVAVDVRLLMCTVPDPRRHPTDHLRCRQ
jgi:hypothetical protein